VYFSSTELSLNVPGVVPEQKGQVAQSRTTERGAEEEGRARQNQADPLRKISQ